MLQEPNFQPDRSLGEEAQDPVARRRELLRRKKEILAEGEDITNVERAILDEPLFQDGDIVNVRRSSGEIDSGWQVYGNDADREKVGVRKIIDGRVAQKWVSEEKLLEVNP